MADRGRFGRELAKVKPVDNHEASLPAKVELRRRVLAEVQGPVFDAFAGSGQMFARVWKDAPGYVGCDLRWFNDGRLAFVADNRRVLRCVDLRAFKIFDLDAYGSPWEQVLIVAARRPIAPGERIGLCLTEGTELKLKMGARPKAMAQIAGLAARSAGLVSGQDEIIDRALSGMASRMRARFVHVWRVRGKSAAHVRYFGIVLEGLPGKA